MKQLATDTWDGLGYKLWGELTEELVDELKRELRSELSFELSTYFILNIQ